MNASISRFYEVVAEQALAEYKVNRTEFLARYGYLFRALRIPNRRLEFG
jgi:hypothetical protein